MKCPHCKDSIIAHMITKNDVFSKGNTQYTIISLLCPGCGDYFLMLQKTTPDGKYDQLIYPKTSAYQLTSGEIPDPYKKDFKEAALIINDSPKASAALSRRCLQMVLREQIGVKPSNLYNEIQEAIDRVLPSYLTAGLDKVRIIGNLGAHPEKSEHTGEIIEVEQEEAEWLLEMLIMLYDYCFVAPAKMKDRIKKLDQKLSKP